MATVSLSLDPSFCVAPVNRRMFGSFVEHMGRCVYTGIYEPEHALADQSGFRTDVLALVRELGVTAIRYPGGNFVSGYRWEDGVGPLTARPRRLDPAWRTVESNALGLNEFMTWARAAEIEPIMAVNLGTRGMREALDLLEYANHSSGTTLSDLRMEHGAQEPHAIRMWCLGNEMDGPWQLGHKTAAEYGRLAAETARAMRQLDPSLELVACGSSSRDMPTFAAWEAEVLGHTYELVDYISAHAYYEIDGADAASFLASGVDMDGFIRDVIATVDHVGARVKSRKRINIAFDEWNVWYLKKLRNGGLPQDWTEVPRVSEDAYSVLDAVVVGSLLMTLLRHSDRVTAACQAQLVNTISLIRTEPGGPAWRQSTFHPFAAMARCARGEVLLPRLTCEQMETAKYGDVPAADAVATWDADNRRVAIFVLNRDPSSAQRFSCDLRAFGQLRLTETQVIADDDLFAVNTQEQPNRVRPHANGSAALEDGTLSAVLPPASWSMYLAGPVLTRPIT